MATSRVVTDEELLSRRARSAREARDPQILNDRADGLNREMAEVLRHLRLATRSR